MRHLPDGEYSWILHGVDHWSKFHFAYPLVHKSALDVAVVLEKYIFPIMGIPSILQSDNGREFINAVIKEVHPGLGLDKYSLLVDAHDTHNLKDWLSKCTIHCREC